MRTPLTGLFVLASAAALFAARPDATQSSSDDQKSSKPVTLVGCVATGGGAPEQFRLLDKDGTIYHLTGKDLRSYLGSRVEVQGGRPPHRVAIVGGLLPSASIAGQAGAQDPAQAVREGIEARSDVGSAELPDFRVEAIKRLAGECPPK